MSASIRIPTQLRSLTGGSGEVPTSGANVGEALRSLEDAYPGFAERIFGDDGQLRRFVNVFLGDEDVRFLQCIETPMPAGASLSLVPAVAGG